MNVKTLKDILNSRAALALAVVMLTLTICGRSVFAIEVEKKSDSGQQQGTEQKPSNEAQPKTDQQVDAAKPTSETRQRSVLLKKLQDDVAKSRQEQPNEKFDVSKPKEEPKATVRTLLPSSESTSGESARQGPSSDKQENSVTAPPPPKEDTKAKEESGKTKKVQPEPKKKKRE